jgi:UDP-N-acetylglucosamine--N-acetylmuramyl-(pentapeptide) pyrophosphoryl-undecaprenol N-acetylglucosamine transferase
MRIVLSGGGTGGHIYPALALAKQIREHHPDAEIMYIGSKKGLEADIVSKTGINFRSIEVTGFKRSLSFENMLTIVRFLRAVTLSKSYIKDFKADAVVGTGGYVCGPVVYAAHRLGIPTMIHEQNVIPGLTNKFLSRFADRIAISFSSSAKYFPQDKVALTGNPRATEVAKADAFRGRSTLRVYPGRKIILVVGGSRGAKAINEAFLKSVPALEQRKQYHFVYVTGDVHYEKVKERFEERGGIPDNISLYPFLYNMPEVLAATDLIVNRAGASFLAEITALGIPSILIPSPYVTNNHQEKNARWLEENGAAVVILEGDLNELSLVGAIDKIMEDSARLVHMQESAIKLGEPAAAEKVFTHLQQLIHT